MQNNYSFLDKKLTLIFSLLFFIVAIQSNAQSFKPKRSKQKPHRPYNFINNIQGSIGIGTATYFGDLCDGGDCLIPNLGLRLGAAYRMTPHFSIRGELGYFKLSGSDKGGKWENRGLEFESNNVDFLADAVFDLFAFRKMYRRRRMFNPYAAIGIGFIYFDSYRVVDGTKYRLRPLQTEGVSYSPYSFSMPLSLGVKWTIHPHIELALEWTMVKTFTDYLDDASGSYRSDFSDLNPTEVLLADPSGGSRAGREYRGDPDKKDAYHLIELKFLYTLKITKQTYNINSNVSRFRMINNVKKKR